MTLYTLCIYNVDMNTAVINLRVEPRLKADAQAVASKLGFNLSSILKGYLVELVKIKKVNFAIAEDPSPWLVRQLRQAEKELHEGKTIHFNDVENAIRWLNESGSKKKLRKTISTRSQRNKREIRSQIAIV